jgi:hypothetical protein
MESRSLRNSYQRRKTRLERRHRSEDLRSLSSMTARTLVLVLVLLIVAADQEGSTQGAQQAEEASARSWAVSQYDEVSKYVFEPPMSPNGLALTTSWVATARIRPSYDIDPEIQFSVSKSANKEVQARLTKLQAPLRLQLQDLYAQHRDLSPEELARLIRVDRLLVTKKECSTLDKIAAAFERLHPPIALENALVLDPRQYQLWLDAGSQQVYMNLLGASSGESRYPVIVWIEEARRQLEQALKKAAGGP